ncbi:hypothetical protein [Ramlibacter sp.]|uniref:hypothetical protein n=1 Tax=Ramlibacter sp. TaxID=1917967 RepID=UPI003D141EEF
MLARAVARAPRPFRMPALPSDASVAIGLGPDMAVAFAMEAARRGRDEREVFVDALAALIREASVPDAGDPAFQALVMKANEPLVSEHVRLAAQRIVDERAVRAVVDAFAHPGKLRGHADAGRRESLATLHALAMAQDWIALAASLDGLPPLATLASRDALQRLVRAQALRTQPAVQRYIALCERRGPAAGTAAASEQGRASARVGVAAEHATALAFDAIAAMLAQHGRDTSETNASTWRAVRGLRMPRGFPGDAAKAKDEWDAALLHGDDVALLAEVKATPAAATPDFARLHRGLLRFAQADDALYVFATQEGEVAVSGESLRALAPASHALPAEVIYCCSAPPETRPPVLAASSKAVLLAEPASIAFAHRLALGDTPSPAPLAQVWEDLRTAPRLRSALHQYDTARAVREAMLRPQELADAVRELSAARGSPT